MATKKPTRLGWAADRQDVVVRQRLDSGTRLPGLDALAKATGLREGDGRACEGKWAGYILVFDIKASGYLRSGKICQQVIWRSAEVDVAGDDCGASFKIGADGWSCHADQQGRWPE